MMFRPGNIGHLGKLGLVAASRNAFNPLSLFAAGEQGAWYDPSDLSTLFQDAAGTIPVTAAGQPVGRMLDKSGRGNHATQSIDASRPTLQQTAGGLWYLACDGVDDQMTTASVNFSSTSKVSIFAGVRKLTDSAFKAIIELSFTTDANTGSFMFGVGTGADALRRNFAWGVSRGFCSSQRIDAPHTAVVYSLHDVTVSSSLSAVTSRINGVATTNIAGPTVTTAAAFGTYPLYLFRRGSPSTAFDGHFYGCIIRGAACTTDQINSAERWMAAKTGVTI